MMKSKYYLCKENCFLGGGGFVLIFLNFQTGNKLNFHTVCNTTKSISSSSSSTSSNTSLDVSLYLCMAEEHE